MNYCPPRPSFTSRRFVRAGSAAALLWLLSPGFTARADEAHKQALINEMFTVTHVDTMMQQMMKQVMDAQKTQLAQLDSTGTHKAAADEIQDRIFKLISDRLSWDKLKPTMTKVYSDNFTEDELAATVAFYKTPAGQSVLTKMPAVMASSMQMVQAQMGDLTPQIQQIVQEVTAKDSKAEADPSSSPVADTPKPATARPSKPKSK